MIPTQNDILTDYQELCSMLWDVTKVFEMAQIEGNSSDSYTPLVNVAVIALEQLISEHETNAGLYQKELGKCKS